MDPRRADRRTWFSSLPRFTSALPNFFGSLPTSQIPRSPFGRPFLFLILFTLAGTHLYTGKEINKQILG
jgi:hypothetical protein